MPRGDEDEVERFSGEDAVVRAGYRLCASWGPRRWRLGGGHSGYSGAAAYAPRGDSIFFVVGNVVAELDRDGRRLRPPHVVAGKNVSIALARDGNRAAILVDRSALSVIELPAMREIFRTEVAVSPGDGYVGISGDGGTVAAGSSIWSVAEHRSIARVEHLCSLSHDGTMALSAQRRPRSHAVDISLHLLGGGAPVRSETTHDGFAWRVAWSHDGKHVAWMRRDDAVIWSTDSPARSVAGAGLHGPLHFVPPRQGEGGFLVSSAAGVDLLSPSGQARRVVNHQRWLLAVTGRGDRALVRGRDGMQELALEPGELLGEPGTAREITAVAWDAGQRAAIVIRSDGDIRVWDVERWCSEREMDPERSIIDRTPRFDGPWHRESGVECVNGAFTRDGAHLLFVDASATVTLWTRDGRLVWRQKLPDLGWTWASGTFSDTDEEIHVHSRWTSLSGYEGDGTPLIDDRSTTTTLDRASGAILERACRPASEASTAQAGARRIYLVHRFAGGDVHVDDEILSISPLLGEATGIFPSADRRRLLVATNAGLLLLFEAAE